MRTRRNQYRECPYCHDLLDPEERCDCREKENGLTAAPTTIKPKTNLCTSIITQIEQKGKENLCAK